MWYVLGEILILLLIAVAIGLIVGWALGRVRRPAANTDSIEAELAATKARLRDAEAKLAGMPGALTTGESSA